MQDGTGARDVARSANRAPLYAQPRSYNLDVLTKVSRISRTLGVLLREDISANDAGAVALRALQGIVALESGPVGIDHGQANFFHRLWADRPIEILFQRLAAEAAALSSERRRDAGEAIALPLLHAELHYFLRWYARRKITLSVLEDPAECLREEVLSLRVFHDRTYCGAVGFEVSADFILLGREGQHLWLKALALEGGRYLSGNDSWPEWRDRSRTLVIAGGERGRRFAAVSELVPDRQRCLVEGASVFVPYQALELSAGRHEIELQLSLIDEHNTLLFASSQRHCLYISSEPRAGPILPFAIIAGAGFANPMNANRISALRVVADGADGTARKSVNLEVDYELRREEGRRTFLECRLLDVQGHPLRVSVRDSDTRESEFVVREEIPFQSPVECRLGRGITLSLGALRLARGMHHAFAEASVVDAAGRVLCSRVAPFKIENEGRREDFGTRPSALLPSKDRDTGLAVKGCELCYGARPTPRRSRSIRVSARFSCPDWRRNVFRVVTTLETKDGRLLYSRRDASPVLRNLCLGGYPAGRDKEVVVHFEAGDLVTRTGGRPISGEAQLLARVKVLTLDDRTIFNIIQEFVYRPAEFPEAEPPEPETSSGMQLVDLAVAPIPERKSLACKATFDLDFAKAKPVRGKLFCEIFDGDGNPLPETGRDQVEGGIYPLDFSRCSSAALYRSTVFQERKQFEVDISGILEKDLNVSLDGSANYQLRAMLFGDDCRLLQIAVVPFAIDAETIRQCKRLFSARPASKPRKLLRLGIRRRRVGH